MAGLVDHGVVVVVALHRVDARVAEPDVASGDMGVGIPGIGAAGVGVVAESQGAVAAVPEIADAEVGEALDRVVAMAELVGIGPLAQRQVHRRHLLGAQLVEALERISRIVRLVVGDAVGIAVVDDVAVPLFARQQAVDVLQTGGAHVRHRKARDAILDRPRRELAAEIRNGGRGRREGDRGGRDAVRVRPRSHRTIEGGGTAERRAERIAGSVRSAHGSPLKMCGGAL